MQVQCTKCNSSGTCSNCGGAGCAQCGSKDIWSGTFQGTFLGKCNACKGTGMVDASGRQQATGFLGF